jgi:DNA repair exonuclease SbcCD ATPase subunit
MIFNIAILAFIVFTSVIATYFITRYIFNKRVQNLESLRNEVFLVEGKIKEVNMKLDETNNSYKEKCRFISDKLTNHQESYRKKHAEIKIRYENLIKQDILIKNKLKELNSSLSRAESELSAKTNELKTIEDRTQHLLMLERNAVKIKIFIKDGKSRIDSIQTEINDLEDTIQDLKSDLDLYSRIENFVGYGIFEEPQYLYETPERYQVEIKRVREQQKEMIAKAQAIELASEIEIYGTSKTAQQVLSGQAKLMLRTFNIECDYLLEKLNLSNLDRTLERIEKIAEGLEKTTASLCTGITTPYMELKFEECRLLYEHKLKKAAQDEEQRLIREQMREEAKALKEYDKAIAETEKEEKIYRNLLEKTQKQLQAAHEDEKENFKNQIQVLEAQLKEAEEKGQRAKSMAEQTRKGYVYIISNIGSFGEQVYKIGLTRRIKPMERIDELSSASVPFVFDVHAIIYSDDAPTLETALHKRFDQFRINAVNRRKEFFQVSLEEIREAVEEMLGSDHDFIMTATANEYYESLRLQGRLNLDAESNESCDEAELAVAVEA